MQDNLLCNVGNKMAPTKYLFLQSCTLKLNLWPKISLAYTIYHSKEICWSFCLRKYVLIFFAEFKVLMFHNNIVKILEKNEQAELIENLPTSYLSYRFLLNLIFNCIHFYFRKKWKYL